MSPGVAQNTFTWHRQSQFNTAKLSLCNIACIDTMVHYFTWSIYPNIHKQEPPTDTHRRQLNPSMTHNSTSSSFSPHLLNSQSGHQGKGWERVLFAIYAWIMLRRCQAYVQPGQVREILFFFFRKEGLFGDRGCWCRRPHSGPQTYSLRNKPMCLKQHIIPDWASAVGGSVQRDRPANRGLEKNGWVREKRHWAGQWRSIESHNDKGST